jgi:hypothetical protein
MEKKSASDEKLDNVNFDLFEAISAVDRKDYAWWNKLTSEQQRKFVPYMMLYWISTLKSASGVAAYYLRSTNHYANTHMFNEVIVNHPQLQWLMLCAASPGMGKQYHQWVGGLSPKITSLREPAKLKDMRDWIEKSYGTKVSDEQKQTLAQSLTASQNRKHYLAQQYPHLKIEDIELLNLVTSNEEIERYRQESGI